MHVHVHGHVHGHVDRHGGPLGVVGGIGRGAQVLAVVLGRVAVRRHASGRRVVAARRAGRVDHRVLQRQQHVGHALAVGPRHAVAPGAAPTAARKPQAKASVLLTCDCDQGFVGVSIGVEDLVVDLRDRVWLHGI